MKSIVKTYNFTYLHFTKQMADKNQPLGCTEAYRFFIVINFCNIVTMEVSLVNHVT